MDIDHMAAAPGERPEKVNVSWRGHHTLNSDTNVCSWGGNSEIFDSSRWMTSARHLLLIKQQLSGLVKWKYLFKWLHAFVLSSSPQEMGGQWESFHLKGFSTACLPGSGWGVGPWLSAALHCSGSQWTGWQGTAMPAEGRVCVCVCVNKWWSEMEHSTQNCG